jgi:TRAP-type C4-dicarboxylate transport system permease small subunit
VHGGPHPGGIFRPAIVARRALGAVVAAVLLFMVALTAVDVIGRFLFASPVPGSFELMEFALAIVVFSAMPLVTWDRGHITVTLFDGLFRGAMRRLQHIFALAMSALAMGIIFWRMWDQGDRLDVTGAITGYLEWPIAPLAYFMAVLGGLSTAILLVLLWFAITGRPAPVHGDHETATGE